MIDDLHPVEQALQHIAVLVADGDGDALLAIAGVDRSRSAEQGVLALLESLAIKVPEDVLQLCLLYGATHRSEVVKALSPLGRGGSLVG